MICSVQRHQTSKTQNLMAALCVPLLYCASGLHNWEAKRPWNGAKQQKTAVAITAGGKWQWAECNLMWCKKQKWSNNACVTDSYQAQAVNVVNPVRHEQDVWNRTSILNISSCLPPVYITSMMTPDVTWNVFLEGGWRKWLISMWSEQEKTKACEASRCGK